MSFILARATTRLALAAAATIAVGHVSAQVAVRLDGDQLTWQAQGEALGSSRQWLQVRDLAAGDSFLPVPVEATGLQFRGSAADLSFASINW